MTIGTRNGTTPEDAEDIHILPTERPILKDIWKRKDRMKKAKKNKKKRDN